MASLSDIETRLFLNNEFVQGSSGRTFTLTNPATEKPSVSVHEADAADIEVAVKAAGAAWKPWVDLDAWKRAEAVSTLANLIVQNASKFAELDALCMGTPVAIYGFQAMAAAGVLKYYAGIGADASGKTSLNTANHLNLTLKQPYGVTAAIIPWNTPMLIACAAIGPAVMAGNAIIIKSSEKAPLSMLLLAKLVKESSLFPPGVIQFVSGFGASTGALLSSHPAIRKLAFTGSVNTGRIIKKLAADSNMKSVSLELGGKSPLIVFSDANIEKAAADAALSIALLSGQTCIASSRVYIHQDAMEAFKTQFIPTFQAILGKAGDPQDPSTTHGPQADSNQFGSVMGFIEAAKRDGLVPVAGGEAVPQEGYFLQPTVFIDPPSDADILRKEIFGPVVSLSTFLDEEEVLARANDTEYGLYASVYTKDIQRAIRLAKQLESGTVAINCTSPLMAFDIAFGGYKSSGDGRQFGQEGLEAWLEVSWPHLTASSVSKEVARRPGDMSLTSIRPRVF
ncbi:aldehyde dehydrogenase [Mytilinidion resinicola]|uniref:aldehyde dehydrogenase (NAD(+)) n=1 Tax=Mytilinidion resinicola TaxID=574789 RepID=A0A6A6YRB3_9PEZI|nr:aldehyde dehydrogenase [Mytilinidion resinicola]KAF2811311.1 aldehyde dehydrogenase [Mytilinidion resinicola]